MQKRLLMWSLASLGSAVVVLGLFLWWMAVISSRTEISFLNVGEGDAILISQGMNQVLIDSGKESRELLARLGRHMPFWDRRIETVIMTHPDTDHVGGFPGLTRAYQVGEVAYSGVESDTETFRLVQQAIAERVRTEPLKIFRGTTIKFPHGGELAIEYPGTALPEETVDTNSGSIVTRFTYGKASFLLTGDLPHEEITLPNETGVTILKAAHHGSKYSTSDTFLDLIHPREVVISVGKNNYGHPAPEVLERLQKRSISVHRTDSEGDITYRCEGEKCVYVK